MAPAASGAAGAPLGEEAGYCVVDGQKVPIKRTRLRTPENREQRLGSYEMFQRSGPLEHAVWDKLMVFLVSLRLRNRSCKPAKCVQHGILDRY